MLREEEWLAHAKRLAIGQVSRIKHLNERRQNLVIGNAVDRYWAYCQACKESAVKLKEHVKLGVHVPRSSESLVLPSDMRPLLENPEAHALLGFLARKGMDMMYLPELFFSKSRQRVLVKCGDAGWFGRDVTDKSNQKWLTYNRAHFVSPVLTAENELAKYAVITEDLFSYFKVQFAVPECKVYCALGTGFPLPMVQDLLHTGVSYAIFMFDGDAAGAAGASTNASRLRVYGIEGVALCAPSGYDPKDMELDQIRERIRHGRPAVSERT